MDHLNNSWLRYGCITFIKLMIKSGGAETNFCGFGSNSADIFTWDVGTEARVHRKRTFWRMHVIDIKLLLVHYALAFVKQMIFDTSHWASSPEKNTTFSYLQYDNLDTIAWREFTFGSGCLLFSNFLRGSVVCSKGSFYNTLARPPLYFLLKFLPLQF